METAKQQVIKLAKAMGVKQVEQDRLIQLERKYPTLRFNSLSKKQVDVARRLASEYDTTVSQAAKHLNRLFAFRRGEISREELKELTGI